MASADESARTTARQGGATQLSNDIKVKPLRPRPRRAALILEGIHGLRGKAIYPAVTGDAPIHGTTPQVGSYVTDLMGLPPAAWFRFILAVLIIGIVVVPAVWSKRPARRKAAAEVLDRIVRLLRSGSR